MKIFGLMAAIALGLSVSTATPSFARTSVGNPSPGVTGSCRTSPRVPGGRNCRAPIPPRNNG